MKRWMRLTAVALCLLLGACPALGEAIAPLPEAEMVEQFPAELELDLEPEADWAEVSAQRLRMARLPRRAKPLRRPRRHRSSPPPRRRPSPKRPRR